MVGAFQTWIVVAIGVALPVAVVVAVVALS
jgi:hypothetical protein